MMNHILQVQLQKLEHKTKFLRQFWKSFELDMEDVSMIKEEAIAERAALSVLKSGEAKGTSVEKVLIANEFLASSELMKEHKV
jgi:hypothetical protein